MTIKLNDLRDNKGARHSRKRKGRGIGSGLGKTAGRGHKGQKSRSGVAIKGFEGGQMPIYRRLPKRGFTNIFRKAWAIVNLGSLQKAIDAGKIDASQTITSELMQTAGLARAGLPLRLLAKGELTSKNIVFEVAASSKSALAAVTASGGKVNLVPFVKAKKSKPEEEKRDETRPDETKREEAKPDWRKTKKDKNKKEIAAKVARGECKPKYQKPPAKPSVKPPTT